VQKTKREVTLKWVREKEGAQQWRKQAEPRETNSKSEHDRVGEKYKFEVKVKNRVPTVSLIKQSNMIRIENQTEKATKQIERTNMRWMYI